MLIAASEEGEAAAKKCRCEIEEIALWRDLAQFLRPDTDRFSDRWCRSMNGWVARPRREEPRDFGPDRLYARTALAGRPLVLRGLNVAAIGHDKRGERNLY